MVPAINKADEVSEEPKFTGEADEFEGGLVPSEAPEPIAVRQAREEAEAQAKADRTLAPEIAAKLGTLSAEDLAAVVKAATAQMREELGAVRAELESVKAGQSGAGLSMENASIGGYPWMYWRKPQNWPDEDSRGWISAGPGGATPKGNRDNGMYNVYARKGMTPITRYGYIEPPTTEHGVTAFLPMLQKGGAAEFPASQVMAYRWHVAPPIRGLKFPQYEAIKDTVKTFECEECGKAYWFTPTTSRACAREYRGHLITGHKVPWREAAEAVQRTGLKLRISDNQEPVSVDTMINEAAPV